MIMKNLAKLFIVMCGAVLMTACQDDENIVMATGITLSQTELDLVTGNSATLTVTFTPENPSNKTVCWVSSDSTVATVVAGKVTACKTGTAVIKAISASGNITATCNVTVYAPSNPATYIAKPAQSYAYDGDVFKFRFLQITDSVTDLTNTGNPNITSHFFTGQKTSPVETCDGEMVFNRLTTTEDSTTLCVKYIDGPTTYVRLSKFKVYNKPSLSIFKYPSGALSILLNDTATHVWVDECTIVDETGKDYTQRIHYDSSHRYVFDIRPDVWGHFFTFSYGPEHRTDTISAPAKPTN